LITLLTGCTTSETPHDNSKPDSQIEEPTTTPLSPENEDEEDDSCFIATASYGTDTAEEIDILREFRDEVLLSSSPGIKFVSLYYKYSPPIANFISEREFLRTMVREWYIDPTVVILRWTHNIWSD
jgi:hypothetical protein